MHLVYPSYCCGLKGKMQHHEQQRVGMLAQLWLSMLHMHVTAASARAMQGVHNLQFSISAQEPTTPTHRRTPDRTEGLSEFSSNFAEYI